MLVGGGSGGKAITCGLVLRLWFLLLLVVGMLVGNERLVLGAFGALLLCSEG